MSWYQLSVNTAEKSAETISDLFTSLGAVSVTYMDAEDQPVYEPQPGATIIWSNTRVIGLFELDCDPDIIRSTIENLQLELKNWQQEIIKDRAWERSWMDYYQPMKFADKLWVCPTDQEQHEANTVCLILDPGLAFGTGTHPTTALCLEWLASHDLADKNIIDYGCGSGILAVAAILLGAKQAIAIDIDPQALTATHDNAKKNSVANKITTWLPEQFHQQSPQQADIVLANILAKPLIELAEPISSLVKPGGLLILSGILTEQADEVCNIYYPAMHISPPTIKEDWCRLDCKKN
jgi:ribosomal protein L11 methyltransferase